MITTTTKLKETLKRQSNTAGESLKEGEKEKDGPLYGAYHQDERYEYGSYVPYEVYNRKDGQFYEYNPTDTTTKILEMTW